MKYSNHREAYRQTYFAVWQKYQKKISLDSLEQHLLDIILQHPEYHALLEKPEIYEQQEFSTEENPFLHMSLHLAMHEQIQTNRPASVAGIYQQLLCKTEIYPDRHAVEHAMMTCLAQVLSMAQQMGKLADEEDYVKKLRDLV